MTTEANNNLIGRLSSRLPLGVVLAVAAGFAARLVWLLYAQPVPVSDFWEYTYFAERLLATGQFGISAPSAYRLPGYPVFLAVMMVFSRSAGWLAFVNVVLSAALIPLLARLTWQLTEDRRVVALAAWFCALNPTFVFYAPIVASEHLYSLLLWGAFSIILASAGKPSRAGTWCFAGAGGLLGLATLTRGEALFYAPVLAAVAYLVQASSATRPPRTRPRRVLLAAVPLAAGVAVLAPWYVRNAVQVGPGAGLTTTSGLNFYYAHNDTRYGFHFLRDTPFGEHGIESMQQTAFEGGDEVLIQRLGYQLGWEYLASAGPRTILGDVWHATRELYWKRGDYPVFWSTRLPREKPATPYPGKDLPGAAFCEKLTNAWLSLLAAGLLAILFVRRHGAMLWVLLYGMFLMNWIGYSWVFFSKPRYRFTVEVAFCILAAVTVVGMWGVSRQLLCQVWKSMRPDSKED